MPIPSLHPAVLGFANASDRYQLGRPDYPAAIQEWLSDTLGIRPGARIVDLGAGTGKFTALLVKTGAYVIAIEPIAEMRAKLTATFPQVEARPGTAQAIPLPDSSVDVVLCAQSFHWFATAAALSEIHRVLAPGGRLALVWNVRDSRIPWIARLDRLIDRLESDAPRHHHGTWRQAFLHQPFGPLQEQHFQHQHTGAPKDVIVNRVMSISYIAALPADLRAGFEQEIKNLIASAPELREQPIVTVPYDTAAFHTVKLN